MPRSSARPWQLVLLNGGEPTWRTQFPIYSDEAAYRRAQGGQAQIAGMSDEDKELIEELQPFRQPEGQEKPHHLAFLCELSNVDKHRVVHTTLIQTAGSQFRVYGLGASPASATSRRSSARSPTARSWSESA